MKIIKFKDIHESVNRKDIIKESYNDFIEMCSKICYFISENINSDIKIVTNFWIDKNILHVDSCDSFGSYKEYEIFEEDYNNYLKIQDLKNVYKKFQNFCKLITDFSLYNKIIEKKYFVNYIWYNEDNEFEVSYSDIDYNNYGYVFDKNEYDDLSIFIENPEMYKNIDKYNL